jgi:hypothetical protein
MTSEKGPDKPASGSRRPAPTIELKATELASEPVRRDEEPAGGTPSAAPEPSAKADTASAAPEAKAGVKSDAKPGAKSGDAPPPRDPAASAGKPRGRFPDMSLALIGTAVAAGIVFFLLGLATANLFVNREVAADARVERPPDNEELAARIEKIEIALAAPRAPDAALIARVASAEAAAKAAGDNAAAMQRRAEELAALVRDIRSRSDAAVAAAEAAQKGVSVAAADMPRVDVEAIDRRIDAIEQATKNESAEIARRLGAMTAGERASRLAVASVVLSGAVERGAPFAAELAAAKALSADAKALAPLEPFAAQGLLGAAALARDLSGLVPAMLKMVESTPRPEAAGILDRLQASAERLVRIRPVGDVAGDEPAQILARIEAQAARADIAGAREDLSRLPANIRAPAEGWVARVQAREAALAAARQFTADALAALGKPNM